MSTIRNISQTVQEREIIKTAPDVVVYLEGLPYLLNYFIDDPNTKAHYSIVNFNDHVTSFNAGYDTEALVPQASFGLQVPNYLKNLYMMPGGNNLIQTMMEVQIFAKGYFLASNGDTVYRRVFKGLVSHIGYSDNGRLLEISVQCHGTLHFLELMQINLSPSIQTAIDSHVEAVNWSTIFAFKNPYLILAAMFVYGLNTAGFQQTNLNQDSPSLQSDRYSAAVSAGYIAKWQAILSGIAKDVHIYGVSYKDVLDKSQVKLSDVINSRAKNTLPAQSVASPTKATPDQQADIYYGMIRGYHPDATMTGFNQFNNKIVSRLENIRQLIQAIEFEGYQDVDGKIIIKPPLYNLDVTNLGPMNQKTSQTAQGSGDAYSSASNPLTEIQEQTNPFVVFLSEILTENETEDQAAIRKTRVTCMGNFNPGMQIAYNDVLLSVGEWIDIDKLKKFGLREEPTIKVPWIGDDKLALSIHAVVETVRANRGYRTYTVTIPLRPELKLGFPIYFPHKDFYGYVKSLSIQYQVGGNATMTIMCDSIRRRVLIPAQATDSNGAPYTYFYSAPNLVYQWTKDNSSNASTGPNPEQSPGNSLQFYQSYFASLAQGGTSSGSQSQDSPAIPTNQPGSLPATPEVQPTADDYILRTLTSQRLASTWVFQPDTASASYVVKQDTSYYVNARLVDNQYFRDVWRGDGGTSSVIPYTDGKGYEVLAPFPWGRYKDLRTVIKDVTELGYVAQPTDVSGNAQESQQDINVLNATNSFLFAGLGTPTATSSPSSQLISALAQIQNEADTDTVIVLDYSGSQTSNDTQLLNTMQPDIQGQLDASLASQTQNAGNQLIDVLVTGAVSPVKNARQVMQNINSTPPSPAAGAGPGKTAAQFANTPPTIAPGAGATPNTSTELDQFKGADD